MNVFRTLWSRFCVRAARLLPERGATSTLARARWAIHDKSRFTELLETLSTLVEKLHKVIPVPDSQYDVLESDLAAILNLSQLKLVETALQSSQNPKGKALSKAASLIISNSKIGTIDRRSVVDWLRDTQWTDKSDGAASASTPTQVGTRLNLTGALKYLVVNSKKSLYFVNTPQCRMLTTSMPCPTIAADEIMPKYYTFESSNTFHTNSTESLRALFPNLSQYQSFQPYEYDDIFENVSSYSFEFQEIIAERITNMLPFGTIYIHTSPCQLAIQTAVGIAAALKCSQLNAVLRVDDRISSSCFQSAADRIVALQSLLAYLDTLEPNIGARWQYFDRIWLDQRLYSLESELSTADVTSSLSGVKDIFLEENYPKPFAGLIIIGEVDFCTPLLQAEPFPWTPKYPQECEVYEITCIGPGLYNRKYISRFVSRLPPQEKKPTLSQPQASEAPNPAPENPQLQAGKRSASPILSESQKRILIPSMLSN